MCLFPLKISNTQAIREADVQSLPKRFPINHLLEALKHGPIDIENFRVPNEFNDAGLFFIEVPCTVVDREAIMDARPTQRFPSKKVISGTPKRRSTLRGRFLMPTSELWRM